MSPYAPRIITMKVPVDKIGEVIGPEGQDHQPDPGRDRRPDLDRGRRHHLRRRRERRRRRGGAGADQRHRQPDDARGRRALPRHRGEDDRLRCVRLAGARQGRPAAHLQAAGAGRRQAGRGGRGRRLVGQKVQVEIAEIDDRGKLSLKPVLEEDATPRTAPVAGGGRGPLRARAERSRADAGPAPRQHPHAAHARAGRSGPPDRPAGRAAGHHRGDAGRALGEHRLSGSGSAPATRARAGRRLALPRAPAVQGHAHPLADGDLRRRWRRSAVSSTPSPARSTPATTPGSSTTTCRSRRHPRRHGHLLGGLASADVESERERHPRGDRDERRRPRRRRAQPHRRPDLVVVAARPPGVGQPAVGARR